MTFFEFVQVVIAATIAGFPALLYVWLIFFYVADMAAARRRDPLVWATISCFFSPLAGIFLLWLVGERKEQQK